MQKVEEKDPEIKIEEIKEEKKAKKKIKKESKAEAKLKKELEELRKTNEELVEKVKKSSAELVNYRVRKDEEVSNMLKYAEKDIITEILPVVDNFERAIKLDDNDLTDELSKFLDGFKMMYGELTNILKRHGVEEINRVGEIFDPNLEQPLLTDKVEGKLDDEVLEVLLKGYKLKDRVLRPATIKINKIEKGDDE